MILGGKYRLEQRLGSGGFKDVWRGVRLADGQPVAVAVLRRFDPTLFQNEVELARRVRSPHVAQVLDCGFDTPRAYVVNELCEGTSLRGLLEARGPLPWEEAARLVHQYALGLAAIHAAHVLHRDVKPDNAILTAAGVKVIDFGISLPAANALTATGRLDEIAGTPVYMAPEVFGSDVDARVDVYALGVTLFELVTGRQPIQFEGVMDLYTKLRTLDALDLSALAGQPDALRALIADMLALQPERRPYMPEVAARLGALVGGPHAASTLVMPEAPTSTAAAAAAAAPAAPAAPQPHAQATRSPARPGAELPLRLRARIALPSRVGPRGVVLTPWPQAPIASLTGARVTAWSADGHARWQVDAGEALDGGLVADLDGDGVGELLAWGRQTIVAIDAGGQLRMRARLPEATGPLPWDRGPLEPIVLDAGRARTLLCGTLALDGTGREVPLAVGRYEGDGAALVDAAGARGFSAMGYAQQAFRGAYATPAAVMTYPGRTDFLVGHLERGAAQGSLRIYLRCYGPGGRRVSEGVVGTYDFKTAPPGLAAEALRPDHWPCDERLAPLAVARPDGGFTILVPYLCNAAWFGPVVVAFDAATGAERWRQRERPLASGHAEAAPILADVEEAGRTELLYLHDGEVERLDVATGERRPSLPIAGAPVGVGDPEGRGVATFVFAAGDAIELWDGAPCLPGRITWSGPRGDLWRSGTLGAAGLPVGPRL